MNTYVAGIIHNADLDYLSENLQEGDFLSLVPEPHNPWDNYAVAVHYHGYKIGFVPKELNQQIAEQLAEGANLGCKVSSFNLDSLNIDIAIY